MIETIRNGIRKFYRCTACSTLFNKLGDSNEHSCVTITKISFKHQVNQGESNGLRGAPQKAFKRSYNIEVPIKGVNRGNR